MVFDNVSLSGYIIRNCEARKQAASDDVLPIGIRQISVRASCDMYRESWTRGAIALWYTMFIKNNLFPCIHGWCDRKSPLLDKTNQATSYSYCQVQTDFVSYIYLSANSDHGQHNLRRTWLQTHIAPLWHFVPRCSGATDGERQVGRVDLLVFSAFYCLNCGRPGKMKPWRRDSVRVPGVCECGITAANTVWYKLNADKLMVLGRVVCLINMKCF